MFYYSKHSMKMDSNSTYIITNAIITTGQDLSIKIVEDWHVSV